MKVLFVLECAALINNGTSVSCLTFARELIKRGHEVRIIGCKKEKGIQPVEHYYELKDFKIHPFDSLITKEGFQFVKMDDKVLYEAMKGVDVVHTFLPFKLGSRARLMANMLGIHQTSAFHMQPDAVTAAVLMNYKPVNYILYKVFNKYHYRGIGLVHCPSQMIKDVLIHYGYKNEFRVISNGINTDFWHKDEEAVKDEKYKDKFIVAMVGRFAKEKRQDVLIRALKYCKHEKDIQIIFCGQGPLKKLYERMIKRRKFTNQPEIRFLDKHGLRNLLSSSDLYVHCAEAEIEGISCIEAFTCGLVPVISDSPWSATPNFALSEHSKFKRSNPKDLARQIDYWFEHDEERKEYSKKYEELGKTFALPLQIDKFEQFLKDAMSDDIKIPNKLTKKDLRKMEAMRKRLRKVGIEI